MDGDGADPDPPRDRPSGDRADAGPHADLPRGRVDANGRTRYEEPCEDYPGCTIYYYSIATGCTIDYDTRAFTNEQGYLALLFDELHSPRYADVMSFFASLENAGTFKDKWDFWPTPDDPYYPWTVADTSVVNMSVIFWSLSAAQSARHARDPSGQVWGPGRRGQGGPAHARDRPRRAARGAARPRAGGRSRSSESTPGRHASA